MALILDIAAAKKQLNITGDDFDDELQDYINAAIECVDYHCGPTDPIEVTETRASSGAIVLQITPVLSITSINGQRYGAITTSDFRVTSGVISPNYGISLSSDVYTVVYQAGREGVPATLRQAAKIILQHQWETMRGATRFGPMQGDDDATMVAGLGYAIPNRALQMMGPHMRGPKVA